MESGITPIHDGRFYYRGHDAVTLSRTATLEDVAALLWGADEREREALFNQPSSLPRRQLASLRSQTIDPLSMMQAALPIAGAVDVAGYDLSPATVRLTGARIVRLLTSLITGRTTSTPIHLSLHAGWARRNSTVADVIRTALVLCADHELNV